jgi:hypothetical protein
VTPELREYVLRRDGGCVAPVACDCEASRSCSGRLTIDHVKDEPRLGVRAPSDARHCATLCERHHLDTGWATAHRPHLREYLRQKEAA